MHNTIGISGSLRSGSFNSALLRAAADLSPDENGVEIESIRDFPLYNGDLESAEGIPASVLALQQRIATADALLLASPEYNGGVPGVMKNAVDWLSRGELAIQNTSSGKPVALMGASPGMRGTALAQQAWLQTLRQLGLAIFSQKILYVGGAAKLIEDGELTDTAIRDRVANFMVSFAGFVATTRGSGA
jgi:chromate reductase, NAD(P)H dehydrogenase (quinone)